MENNFPAIYNDCARILVSQQEIAAICDRLAAEIQDTYKDSNRRLVMVVIRRADEAVASAPGAGIHEGLLLRRGHQDLG